jgi:hypothetical protein
MTSKIERTLLITYLNTTPLSTATYQMIGDGVPAAAIEMNPKITEEQYINENNARVSVDGYAPKMPIEATAKDTDPVFVYIDALRIARAVGADAETDVVNVWNYKAGGPTVCPAEHQHVAIQINRFGSEGGVPVKIEYVINYIGDPVAGTFNTSTKVFTPA